MVRDNLIGRRFEKLTVVSFNGIRGGHSYWDCICDCGKKVVVKGSHLKDCGTKWKKSKREEVVREIRSLLKLGKSRKELSEKFGIKIPNIGHIARNESWRNI